MTIYNSIEGWHNKEFSEVITDLSFSGKQNSKEFKGYINGLPKENGTTYKEGKNEYDKLVSDLFYQKKEEKKQWKL